MFGITMWEMLERDVPYRETDPSQIQELVGKVNCVRILGSTLSNYIFAVSF